MAPLLQVVTGKQGRTDASKPARELLAHVKYLDIPSDSPPDATTLENARLINQMARDHQGHFFDEEYMAAHNGSYGIKTILIDSQGNVEVKTLPLYRPTCNSGHVFLRKTDVITEVTKITHDTIDIEKAGSMELGLYAAKFRGLDCLLMVADTFDDVSLLQALDLERKDGETSDAMTLIPLRLCDKLGLGRSPPHITIGKFKFLFPGRDIDLSQVKPKASKKQSPTNTEGSPAAKKPRLETRDIHGILETKLEEEISKPCSAYKGTLYTIAKQFLDAVEFVLGESHFKQTFAAYVELPGSVVMDILGREELVDTILESTLKDAELIQDIKARITTPV